MTYTEDTLVQQAIANYLVQQLDWESVWSLHTSRSLVPS